MVQESMSLTALHDEAQRLQLAGLDAEAGGACPKVLETEPDRADILRQLTVLSLAKGDLAEAEARGLRAAELDGADVEAWNNLGTIRAGQGDLAAAVEHWRKALDCAADTPVVHANLGKALAQLGQPEPAEQHLREALKGDAREWTNLLALAGLLQAGGREAEAVELLGTYTGPEPEVWLSLARLQTRRGAFAEAEVAYLAALRTSPHHPEGHTGLANLFLAAGAPGEALDAAERVLFAHPEHAGARAVLGRALAALGRVEEAVDAFATAANRDLNNANLHHRFLTLLRRDPRQTETTLAEAHVSWGRLVGAAVGQRQVPAAIADRDPARKLKVGYLSADFARTQGSHVLGAFLLAHDSAQVEVHGYADIPMPDETTAALAGRCASFRNLAGLSDQAAADAIRADGLDILVDLAGHTPGGLPSVIAYTPAPVQIAGPGYDCTRGLTALSHRLTDAATDPLGAETFGPETLLRLDRPALAYIPFPEAGEPGPLPALTHGFLTFGYFGPLDRLNDSVLESWAIVLAGLRGSRLSLPALPADPRTRALWLGRLESAGLDLDRIGFRPAPESVEAHLAAYATVDIALADFPQPSPSAMCEALYMGLPVIGVERRSQAFRPGLGVLAPLGFEAWMPANARELSLVAQGFALHLPGLAALRASLRDRMEAAKLLDAPGLARALEATYRALWASALS